MTTTRWEQLSLFKNENKYKKRMIIPYIVHKKNMLETINKLIIKAIVRQWWSWSWYPRPWCAEGRRCILPVRPNPNRKAFTGCKPSGISMSPVFLASSRKHESQPLIDEGTWPKNTLWKPQQLRGTSPNSATRCKNRVLCIKSVEHKNKIIPT